VFGKEKPLADPVQKSEPVNLEGPIVLDLGTVRDEPVAADQWHTVSVERADAGVSKEKKLPKIFILSRVTDEGDVEYNRTIIWTIMLQGDGLVFTKRCLSALGMPEQLSYPTYQDLADDLVGREVEVKGKHKPYKGEQQYQVNNWRAVTPEIAF